MTDQDRAAFEKWAEVTLTDDYCDNTSAMDKTRAAWLAARDHYAKQHRELVEAVEAAWKLLPTNAMYATDALCDAYVLAAKHKEPTDA